MEASDTVKGNGRRAKVTKEAAVEKTADGSAEMEKPMTEHDKKATSNGDAKAAPKSEVTALSLKPEQPVDHGAIEIAEMFSSAGDRPIAASHLDIYGTILNNRPILASHIKVLDTTPVGGRPIFASDIVVRDDLSLPGGRPIFASDPKLLEASLLPGGRPIAPNDTDDSELLMGYID